MTIIRKSAIKRSKYENTTDGNKRYVEALYQEYLINALKDDVKFTLTLGTQSRLKINDTMKELANAKTTSSTILSRSETSFIIGTVLGDSSLQYSNKLSLNPRLSCSHSSRQSEWGFWKAQILWQILMGTSDRAATISYQSPKNSYQEKAIPAYPDERLCRMKIQTPSSPCLKTIHNLMYKDNRKAILRRYLNYTDSIFLMSLWLDDGSLNGGNLGMFSLVMFSAQELDIFCEWIKIAWNLNMKRTPETKTNTGETIYPRGVLFTDQDESQNFLRLVAPLIPVKTMIYKVCWFSQNNPEATERWKTELKSLVRFKWHDVIDSYYKTIDISIKNHLRNRTLILESNFIDN